MRSKFKLGDIIVVREPIDVSCRNITIDKGERGKVIDVDPDTKDLTIRVCGEHPELSCRRNYIALLADETYKIKRIKRPRNYVPWLMAAFSVVGVSMFLGLPDITAHALRTEPMVYNHLTNQTPHITSGAPLTLTVDTLRARPCIWQWALKWERISGRDKVVAISRLNAKYIEQINKPETHDVSIDTPNLTPGEYILHSTGLAECDYGDHYTWTNEPVAFTVDPTEASRQIPSLVLKSPLFEVPITALHR